MKSIFFKCLSISASYFSIVANNESVLLVCSKSVLVFSCSWSWRYFIWISICFLAVYSAVRNLTDCLSSANSAVCSVIFFCLAGSDTSNSSWTYYSSFVDCRTLIYNSAILVSDSLSLDLASFAAYLLTSFSLVTSKTRASNANILPSNPSMTFCCSSFRFYMSFCLSTSI